MSRPAVSPAPTLLRALFSMLTIFFVAATAQAQTLVLNTGVREPFTTEKRDGFLDQVVAEVFRRLGLKAEVVVYEASERAMINANQGVDDGIALRIKGLEAQYPNLVRVPEKVMDNEFVAWTLGEPFATRSWESLRPYRVGHIIGWKVFEGRLDPETDVTRVKDPPQLFSLLRQKRADVVLYERWQGLALARREQLPVRVLEPPLARQEMFMYLHKRHAALVDKAAAVLAEMKRDGTYRRLHDATLKPLLPTR